MKGFLSGQEIWIFIWFRAPVRVLLQARNGKKIQPLLAYRQAVLGIIMVLKHEKKKKGQQFWCRMKKDALEDYTNRGFGSCLRSWKWEYSRVPSVHIWHGFPFSPICSKANGQFNLKPFKSKESFGTSISNSSWYFWKVLCLCKKLFSWRKK